MRILYVFKTNKIMKRQVFQYSGFKKLNRADAMRFKIS